MASLGESLKDIAPETADAAVLDVAIKLRFHASNVDTTPGPNDCSGLETVRHSINEYFGKHLTDNERELLVAGAAIAVEAIARCAQLELSQSAELPPSF